MEHLRELPMILFCLCMHLTHEYGDIVPIEIETTNVTEMETTVSEAMKQLNESQYYFDKADTFPRLSKRTRREIRTLVDMQKANARILHDIANGVNKLVESAISTEKINPFFISTFLMLADVFQSTSPRIAKNQTDFIRIMEYIVPNIVDEEDLKFFRNGLFHIADWYGVNNLSSCLDLLNAGHTKSRVYTIRIPNTSKPVSVYCDQDTDGGGWLVFQRRKDGSVDFYRSWEEYRRGFGNIYAEFWLGNDILHELTLSEQELRVDLTDFSGSTAYAKYSSFSVGSPGDYFPLSISGYSGTAGDAMIIDNGARFSTEDSDSSCARNYHGPWWHKSCYYSNLNGKYYHSETSSTQSLSWYQWKSAYLSLKGSEMKIRPKN